MTQDDATKTIRKEAKEVKHEGWKQEAKGQLEKWGGKLTGDTAKEAEGAGRQLAGNMEKHLGKMAEEATKAA